jgi:hypothetical protein
MLDGEREQSLDRPLCMRCAYAAEYDHRHDSSTLPVAAALRRALARDDYGTWRGFAEAVIEELER